MLSLNLLPTEILLSILDFVPIFSLKSLRRVCKAFVSIVTPRLFSSSSFIIHKELDFLYDLSDSSGSVAPWINTLHIESQFYLPPPPQTDAEREAARVLSERLAPLVLPKLRNLETLR
jgi:hypothetical protein